MPAEAFFLAPLNIRGGGSGHLRRCWSLAGRLGASLVLEEGPGMLGRDFWASRLPRFPGSVPVISRSAASSYGLPSGRLIVLDRRKTSLKELRTWARMGTPLLLDDSGRSRLYAPFVLDALPGPRRGEANEASPAWLELPSRRRRPDSSGNILVTFGGEDPAGLTLSTVRALLRSGVERSRLTLTLPEGEIGTMEGVRVLNMPENLSGGLHRFGLVITSYGLTAWEAVAVGCAVILVNPTAYHQRLSRRLSFPVSGVRRAAPRLLKRLLNQAERLTRRANELSTGLGERRNLAVFCAALEAPPPRCAACGRPLPRVIARFPRRSYYRCSSCRMMGLYRFHGVGEEYGASYFQEEYRVQYGRSYMEDWQHIRSLAATRLKTLMGRLPDGGTLLDIGCAFGPFIQAAAEAGFSPCGMDASEEAVAHVRGKLKLPAFKGNFPTDDPRTAFGRETFDAVTLWYVIEHLPDLKESLRVLSALVRPGGVLALSTPNGAGISALRNLRGFLDASPRDHYSIWTPLAAGNLLARWGFKVYCLKVTGHHPERFGFSLHPGAVSRWILGRLSRLCSLGDTFEVYAVREG